MTILTEKQKQEIKLKLLKSIEKTMGEITQNDNKIGWLPNNYEALMASAAFNVLEAINSTNAFIEQEGLFKS